MSTDPMSPVDAAIIDHLTRAQRHWLVGVDDANRDDMVVHIQHHLDDVRVAFLLGVLQAFMPGIAATALGDLTDMLNDPGYSAEWVWGELTKRDVDPAALTAFSPRKPKAPAPQVVALATEDGPTGLVLDERTGTVATADASTVSGASGEGR